MVEEQLFKTKRFDDQCQLLQQGFFFPVAIFDAHSQQKQREGSLFIKHAHHPPHVYI
jgi:hypothetical protein